ncbi:hypothetical protein AWC38_SpisGene25779 [Stylophora pistillata]|uniref:Uncharacterized protein n=1 Tax=Stylophora pistillata TaxID=50429 RepID=A0A2B4S2C3_STYPI|nr:hypothetical protein AWC38_SpisGene25779 [Stylophora pistillata]
MMTPLSSRITILLYTCILTVGSNSKQSVPCAENCKVSEIPRRPISFRICGDQIMTAFKQICRIHARELRDGNEIFWEKRRASEFLTSSGRFRRSYTVVEECCKEGCVIEEMREYCY